MKPTLFTVFVHAHLYIFFIFKNNFFFLVEKVLDIQRCDLNIKSNSSSHHTELYGEERLIVRRGQPFSIVLHLSPSKLDGCIYVSAGPLPRRESDTKVTFSLQESTVDTEWSASASKDASGGTITVSISSSPKAPIGEYTLTLDQLGQKTSLGKFTLLFNAWCPQDAVYMQSEEKRKEYVLAQHGLVYRGNFKRIKEKPWNFGQFEPGILDICLKILDDSPKFVPDADKDISSRNNPVYVTRVLSAMINSNDDRGVLVGEWADFSGGNHPSLWMGSGEILRQWAESGPVRYGQCWVFAAVACTVSRALGIPCRVVTNFGSAHDTDANLVIERLYDENGDRISGDDSIWNFHVWVDSWMTRPDLGTEFDGWQTSDPTPQETSEGVFCCGPASLHAVKEGEVAMKYDTPFIFAEVNADMQDLVRLSNGKFVKFSESTKSVGNFISTKAERHDITHQYKYPEGNISKTRFLQDFHKLLFIFFFFYFKIKLAKNMIVGSNFEVYAVLTNNFLDARTCNLLFFARAISYNGKLGDSCGFSSENLEVPSGEGLYDKNVLTVHVLKIYQYVHLIALYVISFMGNLILRLQLLGEARVNQPVTAQLTLLNSLPEPLLNCSFAIEGIGLTDEAQIIVMNLSYRVGTVGAKQEAKASIDFKPTITGSSVLLVNFDSDKLKNIKSFIDVVVKE
uniref:Protein-glutamine gamma-glutamyltransferase 2 n=1 Tax=Cyprinodon variegatus TaxID=28743 RepID=A0A3Q2G929_CYPVA